MSLEMVEPGDEDCPGDKCDIVEYSERFPKYADGMDTEDVYWCKTHERSLVKGRDGNVEKYYKP